VPVVVHHTDCAAAATAWRRWHSHLCNESLLATEEGAVAHRTGVEGRREQDAGAEHEAAIAEIKGLGQSGAGRR